MPVSGERVFLTCRSKNCSRAQRSETRCVLSLFVVAKLEKLIANNLNRDKFCVIGTDDEIDIPHWKVSSSKPGRKKLMQNQRNEVADLDLLDLIGETGLEIT